MSAENKEIGRRIKLFAITKCGSIKALEEKMGVSKGTLGQYIYGRSKPGKKLIGNLEKAGCNIDWLMTGKAKITLGGEPLKNKPIISIPTFTNHEPGSYRVAENNEAYTPEEMAMEIEELRAELAEMKTNYFDLLRINKKLKQELEELRKQ